MPFYSAPATGDWLRAIQLVSDRVAIVAASSAMADKASDQCIPIAAPPMPTVTPEKVRSPWADIL